MVAGSNPAAPTQRTCILITVTCSYRKVISRIRPSGVAQGGDTISDARVVSAVTSGRTRYETQHGPARDAEVDAVPEFEPFLALHSREFEVTSVCGIHQQGSRVDDNHAVVSH